MENREKLIAKIQKLLAMAKHNASNENEAATALRQAESMMRKHDVQFAEIEAQKIKAEDMQMTGTGETRNSGWVWQLAWAASHLTSTMPWKKGGEITFAGTGFDVQVALMMHDYLVGVTERLSSQYEGNPYLSASIRAQRNAFKMGMAVSILKRARIIKEEREAEIRQASAKSTGRDLIVIKQDLIKKQFNLSYSKGQSYSTNAGNAYNDGREAGRGVSLNSQLNGRKTKRIA